MNNDRDDIITAKGVERIGMQNHGKHLAIYLNDHLADSITIINLLHHLQRTSPGKDLNRFLRTLRVEVIADRLLLEGIMQRVQVGKHRLRTATAWLIEKLGRLKLRLDNDGEGTLHLLEAL